MSCIGAGLLWPVVEDLLPEAGASDSAQHAPGMVPLIYSSHYNISAFGLEHLHPFDGRKFAKIEKHLVRAGVRTPSDFLRPIELSREQLLNVHTAEYLKTLKDSTVLASIFEVYAAAFVPSTLLDWRILHPMRLAAGGTLTACKLALEHGLAINLGGGYHHADRNHGGGFCVYSDVPAALMLLHQQGKIGSALIVDVDAHQGNGFANVLHDTQWAHVVDLFDESIYPFPKVLEDMSVPLPQRTRGDKYLAALEQAVPEAIAKFIPDLIVYNAGSDVLASDPLSSLLLAPDELCQRDLYVVCQARERGIPLAMVLSGGYSKESATAHASSIEGIIKKFDRASS
jgi:histone deacetylase 11